MASCFSSLRADSPTHTNNSFHASRIITSSSSRSSCEKSRTSSTMKRPDALEQWNSLAGYVWLSPSPCKQLRTENKWSAFRFCLNAKILPLPPSLYLSQIYLPSPLTSQTLFRTAFCSTHAREQSMHPKNRDHQYIWARNGETTKSLHLSVMIFSTAVFSNRVHWRKKYCK